LRIGRKVKEALPRFENGYGAGWSRRREIKARRVGFLSWWSSRLRMSVPVTFCAQAEEEREQDESNDAPFVSSDNEALPQRLKL
jgi:hypothetical protein